MECLLNTKYEYSFNWITFFQKYDQGLDLRKAACIEALKVGVWFLGVCARQSIRLATLNLLACEYYFPTI